MADHVEIFRRFINSPAPSLEEAVEAFTPLTVGDYEDVHIAALLATIRTRGETFADIAGAARAFLAAGRPFPVTGEGIMDTAGTGGDGANTINITTAASLVAAAGGVKMIKCGNRSVSSKSGSADVLEALRGEDGVLGEEGAARDSQTGRTWVIDPVDGTYNFSQGSDYFCSALALVSADADRTPAIGAVHRPATGTTWLAADGLATRDGEVLGSLPEASIRECAMRRPS